MRNHLIGAALLLIIEGGRDLAKAQFGIANATGGGFGYTAQVGAIQMLADPMQGMPRSRHAGTEFHLLVSVVNAGVGFYAPVGDHRGRKGLLALSLGAGF